MITKNTKSSVSEGHDHQEHQDSVSEEQDHQEHQDSVSEEHDHQVLQVQRLGLNAILYSPLEVRVGGIKKAGVGYAAELFNCSCQP
jgi:ABC-type Zn2+ transport system substrate-binding protein/surface adhesin